ncbi:bifunctional aminotransferase class I/II-fold pyridoxal phosphate-dependent enzyme/GNAT family N-acetyltransferase [Pendulispora rubella]|uniref:Bifunctional aminotransferase class I/II-fold pyridoxal phosphate-dependent enzyme/GNAT family N-acetyltransferase n=1 Tax=Pendulispora rubella TaxID=2741070 RepID=A0ABZ2LFW2_9BACT
MEASEHLQIVEEIHGEARRRKLFFQQCTDAALIDRQVTVNGKHLLSFSSCSYLSLENHPALVQGVHDAVDRYGTQFSSSRGYLSAPAYEELETRLSEIFDGHALVVPTTTLGHQCVLPVLASEKDALILDHQVHQSVQVGATLARAAGTRVEVVRHGELERACDLVARLARRMRTVWFACDGVYSMYGDLAPARLLRQLLDIAPNVRIYVDDAHGMSWAGRHGRGSFLSRMPLSPRIVLVTSMVKAFAAGGAVAVFADPRERERVRMCGGPLLFSGPLQPPMLGAALASARVHLSDEIVERQSELRERVDLCNRLIKDASLPLLVENESPIFYMRLGLPRVAFAVAERLMAEGMYVNVSIYPSVPMKRAGIRLALTSAHTPEDVKRVVSALARHVPEVLKEEGLSRHELDGMFEHAVPSESLRSSVYERASSRPPVMSAPLMVQVSHTIHEVDRALWNRTLGGVGACSWDAMATAEKLFSNQREPQHNWKFWYVVIREQNGNPVCVTHFTQSLNKDDMLMRAEVSEAVEARRTRQPHFLSSEVIMTGSPLSEGNHIYLDRRGPWRAALDWMLHLGHEQYEAVQANMFMLRDMPDGDAEMDAFMLDRGFVKMPMLDSHRLEIRWKDENELAATLSKRKRQHLRLQIERAALFDVRSHGVGSDRGEPLDAAEQAHLWRLYRNVATRKRRLNVYELPESMVAAFLASPAWEVVTLRLPASAGGPADGLPIAWYAAHVHGEHYAPFLCGFDYRYVLSHGAYRQALYQMVVRARKRGKRVVHLGMDADIEKSRFGSHAIKNCIYAQVRDHYNGAVLREIVAEVGVGSAPPASCRATEFRQDSVA